VAKVTGDDDKARFASVVLPHLAEAYALARWITGSRADAEDVVQEACLRAFRAIGGFAGGSPRAWTLTIVRNAAYTWLDKNRTMRTAEILDPNVLEGPQLVQCTEPDGDRAATPETELIAKVDAARLEAAIADLPAPFREAIVLRDIHGLDYREIASITGVPIGTVMSRLARGRRRLITMIGSD